MRRSVVLVVAVLVFGACESSSRSARETGSARASSSTATSEPPWTVEMSRAAAIASVRDRTIADDAGNRYQAKLMSWSDFASVAEPGTHTPGDPPSRRVWVVEILGKYVTALGNGRDYAWGIEVVDARTGTSGDALAGPGSSPPYWSMLPDHAPAAAS